LKKPEPNEFTTAIQNSVSSHTQQLQLYLFLLTVAMVKFAYRSEETKKLLRHYVNVTGMCWATPYEYRLIQH
jgi:hypothetical protein